MDCIVHEVAKTQTRLSDFTFMALIQPWASLISLLVKNLPAMQETWVGKIPCRRERLPLQYSGLENSMDSIVHGVTMSRT